MVMYVFYAAEKRGAKEDSSHEDGVDHVDQSLHQHERDHRLYTVTEQKPSMGKNTFGQAPTYI